MFKRVRGLLVGLFLVAAIIAPILVVAPASATTGAVTMSSPVSNTTYINTIPLNYTLTDTPGAGTVKVVFAGSSTYVLTMTDTTSGSHSVSINLANVTASATVASVSPAVNAIPDGVYTITTSYQNAAFDPPATSVPKTNITLNHEPPAVQALVPTNAATDVSTTPTLKLTFNKSVQKGSGNILIKKVLDDAIIETIAVTSGQVTGQNTATITISPSVTLAAGTAYYVVIPSTALRDTAAHFFVGFSTSSDWQFTTFGTADSTPPTQSQNDAEAAALLFSK